MARAGQARGIIFWGDETGSRSDDVRGRGYAPRGRTPLVRVCHKRASLSRRIDKRMQVVGKKKVKK